MSRVTGEVVVRHRYLVLLDQLLKKKAVLDQLMAGNCPSGLQGEEVALIWLRLTKTYVRELRKLTVNSQT
jgi:hypothetical protein